MFNIVKEKLTTIYTGLSSRLQILYARSQIDEAVLKELELLLIAADTGMTTTRIIMDTLRTNIKRKGLVSGQELKQELHDILLSLLATAPQQQRSVHLLVGVNGSGKTTFAGKLAHHVLGTGKKVLLVGADTFRAAAQEQLQQWADTVQCSIVLGAPQKDPAAVVFEACHQFKTGQFDALIIDTAGRLQTKTNLMKELEKIRNSVLKHLPSTALETLLIIDAMLGQNSLEQAKIFHEITPLDGIVLTKMDGGKGGIIFAINQAIPVPVRYLSHGEHLQDLLPFNPTSFIASLVP